MHLDKFSYLTIKNKVRCHVRITEISVFPSFLTASSSWELLCALWYIFLFGPQTEYEDISSNFLCAPTILLISDLLILTWRVLEASWVRLPQIAFHTPSPLCPTISLITEILSCHKAIYLGGSLALCPTQLLLLNLMERWMLWLGYTGLVANAYSSSPLLLGYRHCGF